METTITSKPEAASCPNCTKPVKRHAHNGCVLAALISCVRDRGNYSNALISQYHANCDVDALWNDLGPIIDRLEAGDYSGG